MPAGRFQMAVGFLRISSSRRLSRAWPERCRIDLEDFLKSGPGFLEPSGRETKRLSKYSSAVDAPLARPASVWVGGGVAVSAPGAVVARCRALAGWRAVRRRAGGPRGNEAPAEEPERERDPDEASDAESRFMGSSWAVPSGPEEPRPRFRGGVGDRRRRGGRSAWVRSGPPSAGGGERTSPPSARRRARSDGSTPTNCSSSPYSPRPRGWAPR
jgi:hypothetical protein